jgi:hypothetical protein
MPAKPPAMLARMQAPKLPAALAAGVNCGVSERCAQPGDNLVDRRWVSVGGATLPWDGLWGAAEIPALVPSKLTDQAPSSTISRARSVPTDLRKERFSTVSTPPMTTSLRQGLRMTQAVRAAGDSGMSTASRARSGRTTNTGRTARTGRTVGTAGRVGIA